MEHLSLNKLSSPEGESEIWKLLEARFPEKEPYDQRKGNVKFPSEAKGWILLHCAGMSEEQRAIVKAKSHGQLDFEIVSQALRSCFPDYKASSNRKKTIK